jgi:hypothetical protein
MNKRIQELKQQAQRKVISHGAFGETETYWQLDTDLFAKLIIQECLHIVGDGGEFASRPKLVEQIERHFGIGHDQ